MTWDHHWHDGDQIALSMLKDGSDFWVRFPRLVDVLVQLKPSVRILVCGNSATSVASTIEHLLVDQMLPRVLAQLGECMVHASAIEIDGKLALFLGPSGWGKSTLAGLLQRLGHQVLSDDCVQLTLINGHLRAIPTYPSLRLNPDSLDALFPGLKDTASVAEYSPKRRVSMPAQMRDAQGSLPVAALYLLGDPADAVDDVAVTPLLPTETCISLIKHSFRLDLADRAATTAQFEICSEIARVTPAFRLDYRRDFSLHDQLTQAICAHLPTARDTTESR